MKQTTNKPTNPQNRPLKTLPSICFPDLWKKTQILFLSGKMIKYLLAFIIKQLGEMANYVKTSAEVRFSFTRNSYLLL